MSIFGIGAFYNRDVSNDFIQNGVAAVGWEENEAPSLFHIFRKIEKGDIVYYGYPVSSA